MLIGHVVLRSRTNRGAPPTSYSNPPPDPPLSFIPAFPIQLKWPEKNWQVIRASIYRLPQCNFIAYAITAKVFRKNIAAAVHLFLLLGVFSLFACFSEFAATKFIEPFAFYLLNSFSLNLFNYHTANTEVKLSLLLYYLSSFYAIHSFIVLINWFDVL